MRGAGFMTQEHCNGCGLGMQLLSGPGSVCQSGAILVLLHHERHLLVLVSSCLQVLSGQVKIVSRRWWRESPDWAPHSQLLSHFLMLHAPLTASPCRAQQTLQRGDRGLGLQSAHWTRGTIWASCVLHLIALHLEENQINYSTLHCLT